MAWSLALVMGTVSLSGLVVFVSTQPAGAAIFNYTDPSITNPFVITAGPDGALWFTNQVPDSIGRITTSGTATNFTDPSIAFPQGITAGPDGALWFTNGDTASIGRITTGGAVTNYPDPSVADAIIITSGPDGALWFTNGNNHSIGQLTLTHAGFVPGAPTVTKVSAGDGQASVSFAPGADGSPSTTGYVASCDPTDGGPGRTTPGGHSPIVVAGLTNGDDYRCTVFAFNDAGNGPRSNPSDIVTPSHGPAVIATCTDTSTCDAAIPSPASAVVPAETVHVTGTPSASVGSVTLSSAIDSVGCPTIGARRRLIHSLTDRGFSPGTRLTVKVTLQIASATSAEGVCFSSTVPFRSRANPKVPKRWAPSAPCGMCQGTGKVPSSWLGSGKIGR